MRIHLLAIAGLLGLSASAFGYSTASLIVSGQAAGNTLTDGSAISPYSGTLGGTTAVTLFCADDNNTFNWNTTYSYNYEAVNAADISPARLDAAGSNTSVKPAGVTANLPSGTQLYEEIAWPYTQMMQLGASDQNRVSIQEAVWHMSDTNSTPPSTYAAASGSIKAYSDWINLAQTDYNKSAVGYVSPNYSNWYIFTDVNGNCVSGTQGCGGSQEFVGFMGATVPTSTPEPASFILVGTGLLAAGVAGRRRVKAQRNKKQNS